MKRDVLYLVGLAIVIILEAYIASMTTPQSTPLLPGEFVKDNVDNRRRYGVIFPFIAPLRLVVAGPSESGKTVFVRRIVNDYHYMVRPPPEEITWFYSARQNWFLRSNIRFVRGKPSIENLSPTKCHLIIIDDLFQEADKNLVNLFTMSSHHRNISVIFITQNFFHQSSHQRNITLNASYMVFLKNPRDKLQISYLARQMYPHQPDFLKKAYEDATALPFSYLLVDLTQLAEDKYRVRTNIFPGEYPRIYRPAVKDGKK